MQLYTCLLFLIYLDVYNLLRQVELHAGAMFYLPCGWFHEVVGLLYACLWLFFLLSRSIHATLCQVELHAGEMLYLPCGWFHEVVSHGEHWAINWWFHPPDRHSFNQPYHAAEFWNKEARRRAEAAAAVPSNLEKDQTGISEKPRVNS